MEGVARMVLMGLRLVKLIEWRLKLLKKKLNKKILVSSKLKGDYKVTSGNPSSERRVSVEGLSGFFLLCKANQNVNKARGC